MEDTDLFKMAGISTTGVAILLIVYRLLKIIQGKKLVSSCCGKKLEVGIAVAPMTPNEQKESVAIQIQNPMGTGLKQNKSTPSTEDGSHSEAYEEPRTAPEPRAPTCRQTSEGKET